MNPEQRARALRLAAFLDELRYAGAFHDAAFLRELAAEQPRVRAPLTQEQIDAITSMVDWQHGGGDDWATHFCRAIERAHGIV